MQNKNSNNFLSLYLLISIAYVFFSTTNEIINYFLLSMLFILSMLQIKKKNIIKKDFNILLWLIFLVFCIISLFSPYNSNLLNSLFFIFCSILFLLEYLILTQNKEEWIDMFIKYLYIFSLIFAIATVTQIIMPGFIDKIKLIYIQSSKINLSRKFLLSDSLYSGYNGLVIQTGTNAYLLSIFIGASMFKFLKNEKHKIIYLLLILIAFVLIILTNKRMLLLASAISILLMYIIYKRFKLKYVLITLLVCFLSVFILFKYTNVGNNIIQKFTMNQENVLSGRELLYQKMIVNFKSSPIIGVGIDSKIDGLDGHNIYLQVASETGIFGILVFFIIISYNILITLKYLKIDTIFKPYFALSFYMQLIFIIWGITGNPLYDQFSLLSYILILALEKKCIIKIKGENQL